MQLHPLQGKWTVDGDAFEYLAPSGIGRPYGIVLSATRLWCGNVSVSVTLSQGVSSESNGLAAGIIFGFQQEDERYYILEVGGHGHKCCLSEYLPGLGWIARSTAGSSSTLAPGRSYCLTLRWAGQEIEGLLDDVPLIRTQLGTSPVGSLVALHAYGQGKIRFENLRINPETPKAFIAMPFSDELIAEYLSIQLAQEGSGYYIYRNDQSMHPGVVTAEIKREIEQSSVLIGVLTWTKSGREVSGPNENVHYEIGYAHALQKPTILVAEKGTPLPFDLKVDKVVFYERTGAGLDLLTEAVRKSLKSLSGVALF